MSRRRHRRMVERSNQNKGVTSLLRRNQAKRLIVWSCRALVLILLLVATGLFFTATPSDTNMAIAHDNMLQYKLVETGTTHGGLDFQRYIAIGNDTKPVSVQEWTRQLASDETNADSFVRVLKNAPYKAYFLETKGVSSKNVANKDFEFVVVNAPRLASFAESSPDPHSFEQHFEQCRDNQDDACAFSNLGGDAMLVAPMQREQDTSLSTYSHLAAFVRRAPSDQVQHLWRKVAQTYQQEWSNDSSVWLSTEGSGVAWLHVRLDSRPKYYHFTPFAQET